MELHALEAMADAVPMTDVPLETPVFPGVTPPGMAYVPFQQWGELYNAEKGFCRGTMFPVLDLPFRMAVGDGQK